MTDPSLPGLAGTAKAELELAKLQAEAQHALAQAARERAEERELAKPLFRKIGLYTALSPVFIAVAGVIFSWKSGWFDRQEELLKANQVALQADNSRLAAAKEHIQADTARVEAEKALIEKKTLDLEGQRAKIEAELNAEKEQFQREKGALHSELATLREDHSKRLADERDKFEKAQAELNRQLNELQKRVLAVPIDVHLQSLEDACKKSRPDPSHTSCQALIATLATQGEAGRECRERLEQRLKRDVSPCERATLLYALYRGVGDPATLEALFALTREAGLESTYGVLSGGVWNDLEYFGICRFLIDWHAEADVPKDSHAAQLLGYVLSGCAVRAGTLAALGDRAFLWAVRFARDLALSPDAGPYGRDGGVRALASLAPSAWCAVYARLVHEDDPSLQIKLIEWRDLSNYGFLMSRLELAASALGIPEGRDVESWKQWEQRNLELLGLWLEPGLDTLSADPAQLAAMVSIGESPIDPSIESSR